MTTIKFPPLPHPVNFSDIQIPGNDEFNRAHAVWGYTEDQLRARDLEVARVVLKDAIARVEAASHMLDVLCALEVGHHD